MTIPLIPCPSCDFTLKPVWFLEKELDNHGIPTGRTRKACSCLLCDMCGYKETLDSCGVKFELNGGDRIMVEDELRQDALSVFDEYDIDAEEV